MHGPTLPFRRLAVAVVVTNVIAAAAVSYCSISARKAGRSGDDTFVALTDDVTRASQAQVAAERMVAIGRTYLLSAEPELLYRAQAADAKLARAIILLEQGTFDQDERRRMDDVKAAAHAYRALFATLNSGASLHEDPGVVAAALRERIIPARERLLSALDQFITLRQEALNARRAFARESGRRWMIAFVVLGIGGAGLSVLLVLSLRSALRTSGGRLAEADRRSRRELDRRLPATDSRSGGPAMFRPVA
jgi:hypothetical protein